MLRPFLTLLALSVPVASMAEDVPLWSGGGSFAPYSTTAESITGPIELEVDAAGSLVGITFGPGIAVALKEVSRSAGPCLLFDDAEVDGVVLEMAADPGPLINGNTLCGGPDMLARWLVLAATSSTDPTLQLAAFSGDAPPTSIRADALCGTFNYGRE